jgi:hypothetical protein
MAIQGSKLSELCVAAVRMGMPMRLDAPLYADKPTFWLKRF